MSTVKFIYNEAIKAILVNMTADDQLPMDMHDLDIHSVVEKAERGLKHNPDYTRAKMVEKLGQFISEDDVEEALNKLEKQNDIDYNVMADDVVLMWQPMEMSFTVGQLLQEIS